MKETISIFVLMCIVAVMTTSCASSSKSCRNKLGCYGMQVNRNTYRLPSGNL